MIIIIIIIIIVIIVIVIVIIVINSLLSPLPSPVLTLRSKYLFSAAQALYTLLNRTGCG
jgi:hypothetical protein